MGKHKDKKRTPEERQADNWLQSRAESFLKRLGVSECQSLADIGCHKGSFSIPAARIVRACGTVYAIDKNKDVLQDIRQRVREARLGNVKVIHADLSRRFASRLSRLKVDFVLLYDVLHRGYMPEKNKRRHMLRHVYRITRHGGVLSCFPTHLKKYRFTFQELLAEIADAGFILEDHAYRRIVHDRRLVRGHMFRFRKP